MFVNLHKFHMDLVGFTALCNMTNVRLSKDVIFKKLSLFSSMHLNSGEIVLQGGNFHAEANQHAAFQWHCGAKEQA